MSAHLEDVRLGVSSCLLGHAVRFHGGHKQSRFIVDELAQEATFVSTCPEVEMGLGTPRETMRLRRDGATVRLVTSRSGVDHTEKMHAFARAKTRHIATLDLDGFVLEGGSPSCGVARVKIYDQNGVPSRNGVGLFAQELMRALPALPVESAGRLQDPVLRDAFLTRVWAHHRLRLLCLQQSGISALVDHQSREKYLLMAYSPSAQKELGRVVAGASSVGPHVALEWYRGLLMRTLARPASRQRHTNVLQHMAGYVKDKISAGDRRELSESIHGFHRGLVPRLVPLTLLRHHIRRENVSYLAHQTYLDPYPSALASELGADLAHVSAPRLSAQG